MSDDKALAENKQTTKSAKVQDYEKNLKKIALAVPDQWMDNISTSKLSLIKSVHKDILGVDKEGNNRPIEDLRLFLFKASQRNLNPFKNQIHAVYIWDSTIKGEKLIPITGIDGYAGIAQRTGRFAGFGETRFEMYDDDDKEYPGLPKCAIVDIYAYNPITGARELVNTATAWWTEYAKYVDIWENNKKTGEKRLNATWANRPKGQLEKCAQALGLRRVFPEELSGLYVKQEVDRLIVDNRDEEKEMENRINKALNQPVKVDDSAKPKPVKSQD